MTATAKSFINSTQCGQVMVALVDGVAQPSSVRSIRFNAAGTVTVTDCDGNTSATLTVAAGEQWYSVNISKFTAVSYSGAVTGWT